MKRQFVKTSNLRLFLAGLDILERRAAPEASIMVVTSEPGFGKTRTLQWYSTQNAEALYIRAKSGYTRHWFLVELIKELRGIPGRSEEMFRDAIKRMQGRPYVLIVDEVEHLLADTRVLEVLRDISDLLETPVVLVGMEQAQAKIARHPQISSRVAHVVQFQPASLEDIELTAKTLLDDITLSPDLLAEIQRQTKGRMREIMNALATCESIAKQRKVKTLSLSDLEGQQLTYDWQSRRPRIMPSAVKP
ncbi:AAA family ATPase [Geothrix sp. PMB-07]|uniref:AAA family ATPase n=1 Tax=Geothrix sp. PMB-07 TaxID=3068640 RepID=UPI0027424E04|nr:ATP-binding protein [Geothrix sp. PMB-07]WLT30755.1 ATP-binding protein [Geothrix sp. PMB-07]